MIIIVRLCLTGNDDHSPENKIRHNTRNSLSGNKPMIVQLSCHTIKSTTAQTFENAEISQEWYVAALKIVTAHGRGGALRSARRLSPPNLGSWIFDCTALICLKLLLR